MNAFRITREAEASAFEGWS